MVTPSKLTPVSRFVAAFGMLPSSYKEAMTYEEQILWLCNFLETEVIPAVNNNADGLAELQVLFKQLKDYVDNYFDNLDIQTEIDNKLDEMVESGQLAEIITAYLQVNGVLGFNTKADMKAATNLIDGSICKTLGNTNYITGDGHFYRVRDLLNTDVIDDVNIIALTNYPELIAELIPDKSIEDLQDEIDAIEDEIEITSKNIVLLSNYYKKIIRHSGPVSVGCMGDSITRGVDTESADRVTDSITTDSGYTQTTSVAGTTYPQKLQSLYSTLFTDFTTTVTNYGISGSTVKDACTYWTQNKNTDLMLMMFGLNDANESNEGEYYGNINQFVYYYETLIKRYLNYNSAIILLLPTSGGAVSQNSFKWDNITAYYQATRMLGKKYNIPVIETPSEITNNFVETEFSDGTHLNTKGYSLLATRIMAALINANINQPQATSVSWNAHDSAINVDNYSHITATSSPAEIVTSYNRRQNTLANNTVVSIGVRTTEDNMLVTLNGYACVGDLKVDDGISSVPMFNGKADIDINVPEFHFTSATETRNSRKSNINYTTRYSSYVMIPNKGYHLITFTTTAANGVLAQFIMYPLHEITQNNKIIGSLNGTGVYTLPNKVRNLFSNDRVDGTNIFLVHILVPNSYQANYIVNTNGNVLGFAGSTQTVTGLTFTIDTDGNWVFTDSNHPNATIVIKL